jgi:uncharacterized RDD family membrane protein YckC
MPTEQSAPALSSAEEPLRYASFWPRFGSLFLDGLISLPVALLLMLGTSRFIVTGGFVLIFLFEMFYDVYLVRRFGGTPGKLMMGLKILKTNGTPITYREALLRASPDLIFSFLGSLGFLVAFSHITAAEYAALPTADHFPRLSALLPTWCMINVNYKIRPATTISPAFFYSGPGSIRPGRRVLSSPAARRRRRSWADFSWLLPDDSWPHLIRQ